MPETFYLDPDYADFVPGKSLLKFKTLYRGEPIGCLPFMAIYTSFIATLLSATVIVIVPLIIGRFELQVALLPILGVICMATLGAGLFWLGFFKSCLSFVSFLIALVRYQHLAKATSEFNGEITQNGRRVVFYLNRVRRSHLDEYHDWFIYQFTTPDGNLLKGKATRRSWSNRPLPSVGTPVKILYADDGCHFML